MYFGAQLSIKALFPQKTRLLSVNLSHGHTTVCCAAAAGAVAALKHYCAVVLAVCAAVIKVVRS